MDYEGYLVVLFCEDLAASTTFYVDGVGFRAGHADEHSAGLHIGERFILLLDHHGARDAIGESRVDLSRSRGARQFLVLSVPNVDLATEELARRGVEILEPPEDRWWGLRCAYFADPDGNMWEIHSPVETSGSADQS
jgi:catechol 2,3-dioxygenase-like lactoylglutathione lyase family enzyme